MKSPFLRTSFTLCCLLLACVTLAHGEEAEEPLITNVFVDTDIREALQDVASQAGIPILADETVSGYVTLELSEVPLSRALEMMLTPFGFVAVKMDGYYLVSSGSPESPAFRNIARSERINLRDLNAEEALALLPDFYAQYAKAIPGKRFITVTAPQPIIDEIRRILELADTPRKQVVIDAVVTEVSGEAAKNLGIEWGGATTGPYGLQFGELASIGGLFQRLERVVATIHLLEKEGKARIRSNPRLVVLDGEEGEIRVTREEYYAIVTGTPAFPTTSLETISAGVILKVRPYVVNGEEIILTLSPEVSNVVGAGLQDLPVVSRRIVSTTVRVKTGETLVLGGLRQLIEVTTEGKVPLLGDIPIIEALFRHKKTTSEDKDVVILITPSIL
jgi:type II secretory pathway component GspD/PulD (secretin)